MGQSLALHRWYMLVYNNGVMVWRDKLQGDAQRQDKYIYYNIYKYKRVMLSDNNTIIMAPRVPMSHILYYII